MGREEDEEANSQGDRRSNGLVSDRRWMTVGIVATARCGVEGGGISVTSKVSKKVPCSLLVLVDYECGRRGALRYLLYGAY